MEATLNKGCIIYPFPNDVHSAEFDSDFVWGAATSAYQIEGAALEAGRGPSIWDTFCLSKPGAIDGGDNGNNATLAYFKVKEDVQMMKKIGLKAYRFSISWSRILPCGKLHMGINQAGVDYYNNLINELKAHDIEPYVTLFHWDTPNYLEDQYMGFLSHKIICDFTVYAEFCFLEFGDRVKHWITLNEPQTYASGGYGTGAFAPGRGGINSGNLNVNNFGVYRGTVGGTRMFENNGVGNAATEPYIVAHNLLRAHANVVKLYRERFKGAQGGTIGITLNSTYYEPLNPNSQSDKDAVKRGIDFIFGWFFEPCVTGKYPDNMIKYVTGGRLPTFSNDESKLLKGSFDFLGLNYYMSSYATTATTTPEASYLTDSRVHTQPVAADGKTPIGPQGGVSWFYSYPPGFKKILQYIKDTYEDPVIYITENGWADKTNNKLTIEEARVDLERIDYHNAHLQSLRDAIKDGVKVKGYFAWSLMDNFEWANGYGVRFGLIFVDYKDGKYTRYLKNSAMWFMNFLNNPKLPKVHPTVEIPKRPAAAQGTEPSKRTRK